MGKSIIDRGITNNPKKVEELMAMLISAGIRVKRMLELTPKIQSPTKDEDRSFREIRKRFAEEGLTESRGIDEGNPLEYIQITTLQSKENKPQRAQESDDDKPVSYPLFPGFDN